MANMKRFVNVWSETRSSLASKCENCGALIFSAYDAFHHTCEANNEGATSASDHEADSPSGDCEA
jgi:hypothetical protein